MMRPEPDWFDRLPTCRPVAEFSVWSADPLRLGEELARIAPYADLLHVDVADGHFAPSLLFCPDLVARVRAVSALPIHVHLMVAGAILGPQIEQFAAAGADLITVHAECLPDCRDALERIGQHHLQAGLALKVETPVSMLEPYLRDIRFVTLLGTAIGVKGKGLHEDALARLNEARRLIAHSNAARRTVLVADGGIRHETVLGLRAAGADAAVLGSLAFADPDLASRMQWFFGL